MATKSSLIPWRLNISEKIRIDLFEHLFPGDNDEHGAIILAGFCETDRGLRLIAKELHLAVDGVDYVSGKYGYRMLKAEFIQSRILRARDMKLAYLAIHNHRGMDSVAFSKDDYASHERGYPALLNISKGMPVGALVFAQNAIAGNLWLADDRKVPLEKAIIIGNTRQLLYPEPIKKPNYTAMYDRQTLLFGDVGQELLRNARVGIIGLGGAGSILAELLGRLGVGEFILADPDKAEKTNLPRLIGAHKYDAALFLSWLPEKFTRPFRRRKVTLAARNIKRANPRAKVIKIAKSFLLKEVAKNFIDCDYLFLAADTMGSRLLFNAIVHQYGIPGVQVGSKIPVTTNGTVGDVFCVSRKVFPGYGCLWCNGLINPTRLQDEAVSKEMKRGYAYLNDRTVTAPSVITLNSIACAHAADDFLFYFLGLKNPNSEQGWLRWNSRKGQMSYDMPRSDLNCTECSNSDYSRLSMGDSIQLPTR